jgi:CRP-like cAMP-binding protein
MISSATYPNQLVASSSVLDSDSDSYAESLEDYDLDLSDAHPLMPIAPDTTQIQTLPQESLLLYNINPDLFRALCLSPDVRFLSMSSEEQSSCFRSLEIRRYNPGSTIIAEGDSSTDMFLVITEGKGFEAEVVRRAGEMRERMITCLRAGQLFGERFFMSRKAVLRNATVRAAVSCSGELEVAVLCPEHFKHWDRLRHFLLIKKVPLFAALKQNERQQLFNDVSCKVYEDGELIIRQGDAGVEFFVVVEGNVVVFENGDTSSRRVLCSLHSGHFFGEMALLTNEPRVASVVADGKVMCLCVAQSAFQAICSNDLFSDVMRRILVDRQKARRLRPSPRGMNKKAKSISALPSHTAHTVVQDRRFSSAYEMRSPSSNVCHASRQLVEGAEYIGGYRMLSRLGRGVHGRVFLCEEAASGKRFAMKEVKGHKAAWTAAQTQRTGANLREAEILRSLSSHRHVVALLDVLQVDGAGCSVYLVLELLVGPLMSEEAQTDHIPEGDCRRYYTSLHSCLLSHYC